MSINVNLPPVLKPAQLRAIAALLTEKDTLAAAAICGVSAAQVRRWQQQPVFQSELQAGARAAIDTAILRLSGLTGQAVDTLKEIMLDATASPGTRLQAVNIHLARLLDLRELATLEDRLERIEKELNL